MSDEKNIITCTGCKTKVDKGSPAHPSDAQHFVCETCQNKINAKELAKNTTTIVVDGSK